MNVRFDYGKLKASCTLVTSTVFLKFCQFDQEGYLFVRLSPEVTCDAVFKEEDDVIPCIGRSYSHTVKYQQAFIPVDTFEEALLLLDCAVWRPAGDIPEWRYLNIQQFIPVDGDRFGVKNRFTDLTRCTYPFGCRHKDNRSYYGENPHCATLSARCGLVGGAVRDEQE